MLSTAGGCLADTESPACPDGIFRAVTESEAPDAYAAAESARAEAMLFDTLDPAQSGLTIALEVVALDEVERVDRSDSCTDDVGHRATAEFELYAANGTLSVRAPGLISLPTEGGADVGLTTAPLIVDDTTVVTDFDRPEGVVLGGLELTADGDTNTVTLVRIDMASDCPNITECDAVERINVASWQQPALDFDLWFDRIGP